MFMRPSCTRTLTCMTSITGTPIALVIRPANHTHIPMNTGQCDTCTRMCRTCTTRTATPEFSTILGGWNNLTNQYGKSHPTDCRSNQARSDSRDFPCCTARERKGQHEHSLDG